MFNPLKPLLVDCAIAQTHYYGVPADWFSLNFAAISLLGLAGCCIAIALFYVARRNGWFFAASNRIDSMQLVLQQQREELEGFFLSAIDLLCVASIDGYFLRLNPEWEKTLGYRLEELEGQRFLNFVHPDDLAATQEAIAHLAQQQPILSFVNRYRHQDGSYRWLEWRSLPKGDRIYATARDITERKHAIEALRQSERTQQAILCAIPDLLIWIRKDGTYLDVQTNDAFKLLHPDIPVSGMHISELLPLANAQQRMQSVHQALETGELQIYEHQLEIEGETVYEENRIVPLENNTALVIVRDITGRKQAEQALQDSETHCRTLLEDLQVGIAVYGAQGEVLLVNSKALELLGFTEAQRVGQTSFNLNQSVVHEDGSPFLADHHPVPQAIATREHVCNVIMGVEHGGRGDRVWLLVNAAPQLDAQGNVQRVVCTFNDVSERQAALRERARAEQELQQREQEFRALVENAPDIIMRLNRDCRYLYINPTVERHSGVPPAAFINKTIDQFNNSAPLVELWRSHIYEAFASGQEQTLEFEIPKPSGTVHYATRIVPEFGSDGSVKTVLAIARDISDYVRILHDREQAEKLLRQSEGRLRLALKAAKFGTWEYNFATGQVFQNDLSELYGLLTEQSHHTYEEWQAQVHPGDRDWVQANFNQAKQSAGEFSLEFRIVRPDGTVRWTLSAGAVVHDGGQPLYAYGIAADITARKRAEAEQLAQQRFLRQVIDTVPNVIFVKDTHGRFLIVNQAGALVHGTTVEAMLGRRETDFNPNFPTQQLEEFLATNQRVMNTRQPHAQLSESIANLSGETRWYQTIISPLIDIDDQVTGIIGATTDVTNLKRAEQALKQAKEAAEAANKAKSLFLANMSHELRTPLNVILGFVQVMQRDLVLTPEQRENLQIIRRSGDHLLSLINEVLDLSKIEAGHISLDESTIDLLDLLRSLELMFRQRSQDEGLQLQLKLAPDLPHQLTVDASKLRQVLINLLGNAIKFTQQGTITLTVKRRYQDRNSTELLYFEVSDTGIGIAPTELDLIFGAFVQTQAGKTSPGGTGLGLTITHKFVQMMGGEISVRSKLNEGSTFAFTLPLRQAQTHAATVPSVSQVLGLVPGQPTYRVLVVDDHADNRKLLVKLFKPIGLEVQEAANGQDAVTIYQRWHPHLIWMDIWMPILNGYEATQQIRAMAGDPAPVIIALTAQASSSDRALALAAGCDDYLTKPFHDADLLNKMAEHLGLQYLYSKPPTDLAQEMTAHTAVMLQPSDLTVMPAHWVEELLQAARLCDDSEIKNLIQHISNEHTLLIKGLNQLVQSYKFKQIMDLAINVSNLGRL